MYTPPCSCRSMCKSSIIMLSSHLCKCRSGVHDDNIIEVPCLRITHRKCHACQLPNCYYINKLCRNPGCDSCLVFFRNI